MIDFSALVLRPAMAVFGGGASLTPTKSQPGVAAYPAVGVFSYKPVQVPLDDGTFHSTNEPAFGIRLADYGVAPKQGDVLTLPAGVFQISGTFEIADVVPDGQGGADLMIRKTA